MSQRTTSGAWTALTPRLLCLIVLCFSLRYRRRPAWRSGAGHAAAHFIATPISCSDPSACPRASLAPAFPARPVGSLSCTRVRSVMHTCTIGSAEHVLGSSWKGAGRRTTDGGPGWERGLRTLLAAAAGVIWQGQEWLGWVERI